MNRRPQTHRIELGRLALHVEECGEGAAVVFAHSLLCDGRMFTAQAAALAGRYRVVNLDFRGHGRSSSLDAPYTLWDQADDLRRVCDALDLGRAAFVGLSMGGMTALRLALAAPDRVAALVLMDTSADPETPRNRRKFLAMAQATRWIGLHPLLVRQVLPLMFGRTFLARRPALVETWRDRMMGLDRRGLMHAVTAVATRDALADRLDQIACPCLVVVGDEDLATPPSRAARLAARLPDARLVALAETGHLSTIEQPERTTQVIDDFLSSLSWT